MLLTTVFLPVHNAVRARFYLLLSNCDASFLCFKMSSDFNYVTVETLFAGCRNCCTRQKIVGD